MSFRSSSISLLVLVSTQSIFGLTYSQLQDCVGSNYVALGYGSATVCQLDSGSYGITNSNPLLIYRSHITVAGTFISSTSDTTLYRAAATRYQPYQMVTIQTGVTDVVFYNLYIDGRRHSYSTISVVDGGWIDVETYSATGVEIVACEFVDAIGFSVEGASSDLWVHYSIFSGGGYGGIKLYDDTLVETSIFEYAGANAVTITGMDVTVQDTWFFANHEEFPFDSGGGQIAIEGEANYVDLNSNAINGDDQYAGSESYYLITGIEVTGNNVNMYGNSIYNNSGAGISINRDTGDGPASYNSAQTVHVYGIDPRNPYSGYFIASSGECGVGIQGRTVDGYVGTVTLDNVTSTNNSLYGACLVIPGTTTVIVTNGMTATYNGLGACSNISGC